MSNQTASTPAEELAQILASAQRLGIELDEAEALQWLASMAANLARPAEAKPGQASDVEVDERSGVFGHRVAMLDFNPQELAYFRRVGKLVEFRDQPGRVETALALSGSSAQSKIQTYPGDCDYFERVNILAGTRQEACQILAELMRAKALEAAKGPGYQLIEVKFGSYPFEVVREGKLIKRGTPIAWRLEEIQAGQIEAHTPAGASATITWEQVADDPGWCKLDWVVADAQRNQLANASNMLDVTWEAPDGSITPLDGYLDPYFQEVYLEAESIPIFSKLSQHVSADALDDYVSQLEKEVKKYLTYDPLNYGKAAKRMYNIFRLTGRYREAAFLRELFDEPAALLYQVWSLIRTLDDSSRPGSSITREELLAEADQLILSVVRALEGDQETEIVGLLLQLRDSLDCLDCERELSPQAEALRAQVINVVNNFFYEKLTAVPEIKGYIEGFAGQ